MVFARNQEEGEWMWGEHRLPRVCSYRYMYLGIDFACACILYTCICSSDVNVRGQWQRCYGSFLSYHQSPISCASETSQILSSVLSYISSFNLYIVVTTIFVSYFVQIR